MLSLHDGLIFAPNHRNVVLPDALMVQKEEKETICSVFPFPSSTSLATYRYPRVLCRFGTTGLLKPKKRVDLKNPTPSFWLNNLSHETTGLSRNPTEASDRLFSSCLIRKGQTFQVPSTPLQQECRSVHNRVLCTSLAFDLESGSSQLP